MKLKHLILRVTNGDGYSNPLINIYNSHAKANKAFNESVGNFVTEAYGGTIKRSTGKTEGSDGAKFSIILEDIDEQTERVDLTAVHHIELLPKCFYVLGITCNYVDEFSLNAFGSYTEAESFFKECTEKIWEDSEEITPNTFFGDDGTEFKYYTVLTTY